MRTFFILVASAVLAGGAASRGESQAPSPGTQLAYADLADLALSAPVAVHVRVSKALPLGRERSVSVPPHLARLYVEAEVVGLIRGPGGLPKRVSYVVDLPRGPKGRAPRLRKGSQLLLLAAPVSGRANELRLVAPDAQLDWTAATAEQLRTILGEASSPDAPPAITGIGRAFHVQGTLPGESETQIFLQTADGRPVSLSVLRRPGETAYWAVALSEVVDDAAAAPPRNSLLWYRLACTLPPSLPAPSLAEADAGAAAAIRADYRLVLERLGPCARTRNRR